MGKEDKVDVEREEEKEGERHFILLFIIFFLKYHQHKVGLLASLSLTDSVQWLPTDVDSCQELGWRTERRHQGELLTRPARKDTKGQRPPCLRSLRDRFCPSQETIQS